MISTHLADDVPRLSIESGISHHQGRLPESSAIFVTYAHIQPQSMCMQILIFRLQHLNHTVDGCEILHHQKHG